MFKTCADFGYKFRCKATTMCAWKVTRLVLPTTYFNFKQQSNIPCIYCAFTSLSATFLCIAGGILLGSSSVLLLWLFWWPPSNRPLELEEKNSHTEQDQINSEVFLLWQCSSQPETAGCSGCCEQVSWWSNHNLFCHNFCLFPCSEQNICCRSSV